MIISIQSNLTDPTSNWAEMILSIQNFLTDILTFSIWDSR